MAINANFRLDPFTNNYILSNISDESQTCGLDAVLGRYGFRLNEAPDIKTSGNTLTVVEDTTGGATWTEISSSIDPSAGEYRVDRTYNQGFVEMNAGDNGKSFLITYQGRGSIVDFAKLDANISLLLTGATNRTLGADLTVSGDLAVSWGGSATGIAGWLEDGTPYYIKVFEDQLITNGNTFVEISHGISNAKTDDRILHVRCKTIGPLTTGGVDRDYLGEHAGSQYIFQQFEVSDTSIYVARGSGLNDYTFNLMIWYK